MKAPVSQEPTSIVRQKSPWLLLCSLMGRKAWKANSGQLTARRNRKSSVDLRAGRCHQQWIEITERKRKTLPHESNKEEPATRFRKSDGKQVWHTENESAWGALLPSDNGKRKKRNGLGPASSNWTRETTRMENS
jgi:hypothetical protein